ncbi:MAG: hypothetical protein AAGL96_13235 [Pseudomonadota bacterium]
MSTVFATYAPRALPLAFTGYVMAVVLAHVVLPVSWTWLIGFAALLGMLFTYPVHAALQGAHVRLEVGVSAGFVVAGLLGLLISPIILIAAIAAHGLLDAVKYVGVGATVPVWYLIGCALFDVAYAAYLTTFL